MKKNFLLTLLAFLPALHCHPGQNKKVDTTCVTGFDVERYLGTWYELARFPHRFEKGLQGVQARYTLQPDGSIEVLNSGYENNLQGPRRSAEGKAKLAGDPNTGHLKVAFFLWFYADYRILELDTTRYQYALVGSSSDHYLWLLARSPYLADSTYQMLVTKAAERGYDTSRLVRVQHKALLKIDPGRSI